MNDLDNYHPTITTRNGEIVMKNPCRICHEYLQIPPDEMLFIGRYMKKIGWEHPGAIVILCNKDECKKKFYSDYCSVPKIKST